MSKHHYFDSHWLLTLDCFFLKAKDRKLLKVLVPYLLYLRVPTQSLALSAHSTGNYNHHSQYFLLGFNVLGRPAISPKFTLWFYNSKSNHALLPNTFEG